MALDRTDKARSWPKKLSTIFVDNIVDSLHNGWVSGVGKSFFRSTIKKYAPKFIIVFNGLYSRAAWIRGFRGVRITI